MDPDEQVREVVRLIFDKYDEIGTAWGVFHYLIRNNIRLGFRPFHGPNRGELGVAAAGPADRLSRSCGIPSTPGPTPMAAGPTSASGRPPGSAPPSATGCRWTSGRS